MNAVYYISLNAKKNGEYAIVLTVSYAYAEAWAGSFVGDIKRIYQLKLIIHVLV